MTVNKKGFFLQKSQLLTSKDWQGSPLCETRYRYKGHDVMKEASWARKRSVFPSAVNLANLQIAAFSFHFTLARCPNCFEIVHLEADVNLL